MLVRLFWCVDGPSHYVCSIIVLIVLFTGCDQGPAAAPRSERCLLGVDRLGLPAHSRFAPFPRARGKVGLI